MAEWLGYLSPGPAGGPYSAAFLAELAPRTVSQAAYLNFDQGTGPGSALQNAADSLVANAPVGTGNYSAIVSGSTTATEALLAARTSTGKPVWIIVAIGGRDDLIPEGDDTICGTIDHTVVQATKQMQNLLGRFSDDIAVLALHNANNSGKRHQVDVIQAHLVSSGGRSVTSVVPVDLSGLPSQGSRGAPSVAAWIHQRLLGYPHTNHAIIVLEDPLVNQYMADIVQGIEKRTQGHKFHVAHGDPDVITKHSGVLTPNHHYAYGPDHTENFKQAARWAKQLVWDKSATPSDIGLQHPR